jgi:hypothetical protein
MSEAINNEIRTVSPTGGEKGVKPERFDLIPVEALSLVAQLYGKGAEKYDEHNWRRGYEWSKSYAALQRHSNAFWQGEDLDPEMGLPHMASVVFHALTLITFMQEQPNFDDRYKPNDDALEALRQKLLTPSKYEQDLIYTDARSAYPDYEPSDMGVNSVAVLEPLIPSQE